MHDKPFAIAINKSKYLLSYLIIVHTLMLVTMISLLNNSWALLAAVLVLLISFIFYCQRYQWLTKRRTIIKVERDIKGRWRILYSDNSFEEKLDLKHCVVTPLLVMLNFIATKPYNGKSVIIMADAVDPELFRQLRVYCRDVKTFQQ